jgi:hypothetical protein
LIFVKTYVSHEMLHHAEPKLFFVLMHMLELFEFEFLFEFELSSLEKIKRKEIRNSEKKGKPNSAQPSTAGPHARPRCLTGGLHLSVAVLALACSLLLPLPSGPRVSASLLFARAHRSFSVQPESRRRRPKPSSCPCCRSRVLESPLKVTNLPRP